MTKLATKQKKPRFDLNVYVACSLTHAPEEFRQKVKLFKDKLRPICNIMDFRGLTNDPPREVFNWDIHECVRKSDLVVAICDLPSTGLGYEIGTQVEARGAHCLAMAHDKAFISDFIIGIGGSGYEFRRYRDLHNHGFEMVVEKLEKMLKLKKPKSVKVKAK